MLMLSRVQVAIHGTLNWYRVGSTSFVANHDVALRSQCMAPSTNNREVGEGF